MSVPCPLTHSTPNGVGNIGAHSTNIQLLAELRNMSELQRQAGRLSDKLAKTRQAAENYRPLAPSARADASVFK